VQLAPGDSLVIFSDGLLDFFDDEEATYSYLSALMTRHASPQGFVDALVKLTPDGQPDDCTVIAVRRSPA
jgi:sigma-B regulation protein RsbU (phosphoserine phosphatase)